MKIKKNTILTSIILIIYFGFVYLGLSGSFVIPKTISFWVFNIHLYSVFIFLGIWAAFVTFKYLIKDIKELQKVDYYDMLLYAVIAGAIGARVWHVVTDWHLYETDLIKVFYIWNGGLGIFGAIIFGSAGVYYFAKQNKLDFLKLVNVIAITMPLAQAIGRVGNFINQELYGFVTEVLWGWYIPVTRQFHHPTFLYEQILNLTLFSFLFTRYKTKGLDNKYLPMYLVGYSFIRFVVEIFRLSPRVLWGMSVAQISSLVIIVVVWIWWGKKALSRP